MNSETKNPKYRALVLILAAASLFLLCSRHCEAFWSNESDKQYEKLTNLAKQHIKEGNFLAATEAFFDASQIKGSGNDRSNFVHALEGFFKTVYELNQEHQKAMLKKMSGAITAMKIEETQKFMFFKTGIDYVDKSVVVEVKRNVAASLRGGLWQLKWGERLAFELRAEGVIVKEVSSGEMYLSDASGSGRQFNVITIYGEVDPKREKEIIQKVVLDFLHGNRGPGKYHKVIYFDANYESGLLIKKHGRYVVICDL
jgi:hypothetical protein